MIPHLSPQSTVLRDTYCSLLQLIGLILLELWRSVQHHKQRSLTINNQNGALYTSVQNPSVLILMHNKRHIDINNCFIPSHLTRPIHKNSTYCLALAHTHFYMPEHRHTHTKHLQACTTLGGEKKIYHIKILEMFSFNIIFIKTRKVLKLAQN